MSDQFALRAAICAQPDEDTPRLVYADWLDEHGGAAGAKRAAFIRGEIADHHADRADTEANVFLPFAEDLERVDWAAVDADLGACFARQKAADKRQVKLTVKGERVPRVPGVAYAGSVRGFFSRVWAQDTASFLRHMDAIFRAAPITELIFNTLTAEQAADFVRSGHLAQIRELDLRLPADPDALRVLGAARDAAGVRKLTLTLNPNGAGLLAALAGGRFWTGLHALHATSYRTDPEGNPDSMTELLAANPFPQIRELHVWATRMTDDAARLVARNFPELRLADLAINEITNVGAAALAASKSLKHLRHLDIASCDLEGGAPAGTALVLTNNLPNLVALKVDDVTFRPTARQLTKGVRGPTLRALALNTATFTPATLEALVKCPALRGLWHLETYISDIGDEHVERFVKHAAFDRLTALDLSHNEIGSRGAKALAAWPGAARLQWLDLRSNDIGEAGAKALAASPYLAGLKTIRYSGRGTSTVKKRFKKAFE